MAAYARLKIEFTEDETYHILMRWLIYVAISYKNVYNMGQTPYIDQDIYGRMELLVACVQSRHTLNYCSKCDAYHEKMFKIKLLDRKIYTQVMLTFTL